MKTAFKLLKKELELNNELFRLGFISYVEKICKDQHSKFLYESQKRDSQ